MYNLGKQITSDMKRWEGLSLSVYLDSRGFATQGFGRHTGISVGDPDVSIEMAVAWLQEDMQTAYKGALTLFPDLDQLANVRRDTIVSLVFNMGVGKLSVFVPFITAVNKGDYNSAAYHLLVNLSGHLTPYLTQTGKRAVEIALRIATGEIPQEFKV